MHIRQDHGKRIGQKKADGSAGQRQLDGKNERLGMFRGGYGYDIGQGKGAGLIGHSIVKYHAQRDDDKGAGPQDIRKRK